MAPGLPPAPGMASKSTKLSLTQGGSTSQKANEMADKGMYKPVEYVNASKPGPALIVIPGDVKSNNVDWNQYTVRGWNSCVLNADNNGRVTPLAYSVQQGCSATDFSQYDWIVYPTLAGQRLSPVGAGDLRMKPYVNTDLALTKSFRITERLTARFRTEIANAMNHFNILTGRFNNNPVSPNFGTIQPASTPSLDAPPRVITLGLKLNW